MIESDIAELVSLFMSSFGIGFLAGYILRVFHRATDLMR